MTYEEARFNIINVIEKMNEPDLIELYNTYCRHSGNKGKQIYMMSELNDELYDLLPNEIINIVDCNFDTYDDFFMYNKRGILISFSSLDGLIDINDIVDCILIDEDDLYNKEIENILKEYDIDDEN